MRLHVDSTVSDVRLASRHDEMLHCPVVSGVMVSTIVPFRVVGNEERP